MKKKLLLGLLAAPLILASCGGNKPAEESKDPTTSVEGESKQEQAESEQQQEQSQAPETSVEPELTRAEKVTALFAKMATGATSTFVDPTYSTLEYYGDDKGYLRTYTDEIIEQGAYNGGIVKLANYGLFLYSYDMDTEMVDGYQIYSTSAVLDISDLIYTTKDLGLAADTVTFAESARTHTFSTSDDDFCSALACLAGYKESEAEMYPTKKVDFKISDDGESITDLNLSLSGATDKTSYKDTKLTGLSITKVGKTIDLGVEDFIANPPSLTARTAWTTSETSAFASVHANFSLPFPTGATWAITESLSSGQFVWRDYKCGDKTTSYKAQVEAAGFTVDADNTKPAQKLYYYEKVLAAKTSSSKEIRQVLAFTYQNDAETLALHPAGAFIIVSYAYQVEDFTSEADVNADLATHKSHENNTVQIFPTVNFGTNQGIVYNDVTTQMAAQYPDYDQLYYGVIKVYYATLAQAQAAITSITAQFVAKGYADYTSYYQAYGYDIDMVVVLDDGSTEEMDYSCAVYGVIAYDDDDNYAGYITLEIDHSGY